MHRIYGDKEALPPSGIFGFLPRDPPDEKYLSARVVTDMITEEIMLGEGAKLQTADFKFIPHV
jgi:hypothetical protein